MFCKWCGVKKKGVESQCSNCKMPFDPLVSSGVPKGFPDQLHIIKESDNASGSIIESNTSGISEDCDDNTTKDTPKTEDSGHLLYQYRRLKIVIIILSVLLLTSVVSFSLLISQFVKKEDIADDKIINEDTSILVNDESMSEEPDFLESSSILGNNDSNNDNQDSETVKPSEEVAEDEVTAEDEAGAEDEAAVEDESDAEGECDAEGEADVEDDTAVEKTT